MKRYIKMLFSVVSAFALLFSAATFATGAQSEKKLEKYTDIIELSDNAFDNFYTITDSLEQADSTHLLTVKIAKAGKYKISSYGSAIMMRSNVILDLNGSTLIRSGKDINNLFQNEDFNGNRDNGGYKQTYNFAIKNGTLDGSGGSADEQNLVNFGHANNITIENVNFKNCKNSHLIELSGCRDVTVKGCTFTGFTGGGKSGNYNVKEALQLDVCHESDITWNGTYKLDNTVCKNITVKDCVFKDYPSGVGNHHALAGVKNHSTNIKIINNKFLNTLPKAGCAIWCFGFENSLVKGNKISGNYNTAIMVSAGSVTVSNNTVSKVSYAPLYITKATSSSVKNKTKTVEEKADSCVVKNNTLTTKGECNAVTVYSGSKLLELSGNTIASEKKSGVICSGKGSAIKTVKGNKITKAGEYGIAAANKAQIDTISDNTVNGKEAGVRVTSGATVKNITRNTKITSSSGEGILVSGASVKGIIKNTVKNCGANGIFISSTGKAERIEANKISANREYGVRVNNAKTTVYMGLNKYSKNKSGNEKTLATVKEIYSVKYELNGGTNNKSNPESYTANTSTVTLKNPTRKGYGFKGWYCDSKFKTKVTKIAKGSKGNKTFYAKWKKK